MAALTLVTMTTGDVGLIVNQTVVMTSDPVFPEDGNVAEVAARLAQVLGVPLETIGTEPPRDSDWTWEDVVETIPHTNGARAGGNSEDQDTGGI